MAVVEDGRLSRVGSVASVVATTSSIAIQGVVILDEPLSRQWFEKFFFARAVEISAVMVLMQTIDDLCDDL